MSALCQKGVKLQNLMLILWESLLGFGQERLYSSNCRPFILAGDNKSVYLYMTLTVSFIAAGKNACKHEDINYSLFMILTITDKSSPPRSFITSSGRNLNLSNSGWRVSSKTVELVILKRRKHHHTLVFSQAEKSETTPMPMAHISSVAK